MDNPGLSLFNGGMSLQLDAVGEQQREEEEQDREEARRIDQELRHKLEGAFDDLEFDDDDDSSLCSPPGAPRTGDMVTPGGLGPGDQYLTSTPYTLSHHPDVWETPQVVRTPQGHVVEATGEMDNFQGKVVHKFQAQGLDNFEARAEEKYYTGAVGSRRELQHPDYHDLVNKSDSEKVA